MALLSPRLPPEKKPDYTNKKRKQKSNNEVDSLNDKSSRIITMGLSYGDKREHEMFDFYYKHYHQLNSLKSMANLSRCHLNQKHHSLDVTLDVLNLWCICILNLITSKPYSPNSNSSSSSSLLSNSEDKSSSQLNKSFEKTLLCHLTGLMENSSELSFMGTIHIVIEGYLVAGCISYVSMEERRRCTVL